MFHENLAVTSCSVMEAGLYTMLYFSGRSVEALKAKSNSTASYPRTRLTPRRVMRSPDCDRRQIYVVSEAISRSCAAR